jgi:hypothetical protein
MLWPPVRRRTNPSEVRTFGRSASGYLSQYLDGPQGRGYSCCDGGRLTIDGAAVISNHRIGRLESVRGAHGTVLG